MIILYQRILDAYRSPEETECTQIQPSSTEILWTDTKAHVVIDANEHLQKQPLSSVAPVKVAGSVGFIKTTPLAVFAYKVNKIEITCVGRGKKSRGNIEDQIK